jgi:hypothetical protein
MFLCIRHYLLHVRHVAERVPRPMMLSTIAEVSDNTASFNEQAARVLATYV